jgi:hypothetical protein
MNNQPTSPESDDYLKGRNSDEYRRLREQARMGEESTRRLPRRIGVGAGMRCLDVCCGPGIGQFLGVYRSLLPRALRLGLTTVARSGAFMEEISQAASSAKYYSTLAPLLIGAWNRKPV